MEDRAKRTLSVLVLLTAVAAVLRLAVVVWVQHRDPTLALTSDSKSYLTPAKALVVEHLFKRSPGAAGPEFFRTPGYPFFIAIVFQILGMGQTALLVAQALLAAVVVPLTYGVARRLASWRAAVLAAALVAVEPSLVLASSMVMSEWISAVTILPMAYAGVRFFDPDSGLQVRWALGLGCAIVVATMVRPTTYYFPIVVVLLTAAVIVRRRSSVTASQLAVLTFVFLLPVATVFGAWQWRNHELVGTWRLSSVEAVNLFHIRGPHVLAAAEGIPIPEARDRLSADVPPVEGEPAGVYADRTYARGLREVTAHPAVFVGQTAYGLGRELLGIGGPSPFRLAWATSAVLRVGLVVLYGLALLGARRLLRARDHTAQHAFVLLLVAYVVVVSALGAGLDTGPRFRVPIIALVCVYAGAGLEQVLRWRGLPRWGRGARDASEIDAGAAVAACDDPSHATR